MSFKPIQQASNYYPFNQHLAELYNRVTSTRDAGFGNRFRRDAYPYPAFVERLEPLKPMISVPMHWIEHPFKTFSFGFL